MKGGKARRVALGALFAAAMVCGKELLRFVPNVHPVTLLLAAEVIVLGYDAFWSVLCFVLAQTALYGLGLWTAQYLLAWNLAVLAALPFRHLRSRTFWALFGAIQGLTFGTVCAAVYAVAFGLPSAFSYWLAGIPYDFLHAAGNAAMCFFLLPPLLRVAETCGRTLT